MSLLVKPEVMPAHQTQAMPPISLSFPCGNNPLPTLLINHTPKQLCEAGKTGPSSSQSEGNSKKFLASPEVASYSYTAVQGGMGRTF